MSNADDDSIYADAVRQQRQTLIATIAGTVAAGMVAGAADLPDYIAGKAVRIARAIVAEATREEQP